MMSLFVVCHAPVENSSALQEIAIAQVADKEESALLTPREMVGIGVGSCFDCCIDVAQCSASLAVFAAVIAFTPLMIISGAASRLFFN